MTQSVLLGLLAAEEEDLVAALQHFTASLSYIREAFLQQQQQQQDLQQQEQQEQQHLMLLVLRSDFVARHAAACLSRRPHTPEETPELKSLQETVAAADASLRKEIEQAMQQQQEEQQEQQ